MGGAPGHRRRRFCILVAMTTATPISDAQGRWQHAEALAAADRLDEAAEAYRSLGDDAALAVPAQLRLSQLATRRGQLRDAVAAALAAFERRRPEPALMASLARVLRPLGELRAMFACAHDLSVLRGRNPGAMLELGTLLSVAGFHADAVEMLGRAGSAGAGGPKLLLPLARSLQALGRDEEARDIYGACIKAAPSLAAAWLGVAELGDPDAATEAAMTQLLRQVAASGGADDSATARLHYALFRLLDRGTDTDAAWAALERGMALERAALADHDPAAETALLDHLAGLRAGERDTAAGGSPAGAPVPIFVVGLHAPAIAGLGALLARHPQVGDLGETRAFVQQLRWCADAFGPPRLDLDLAQRAETVDFGTLGERYLAHSAWRAPGKAAMLDRNRANFANVAYIARALPQARILHLAAAPMDTCFAALSTWTDAGAAWSHDQAETAACYRGYRRLMAHWRSLFPERVLDVRQDELLSDPAATLGEVLRFCGLDDGAAPELAAGVPALLGEGRAAPQRWRRYEAQLAPLKAGLGALAY